MRANLKIKTMYFLFSSSSYAFGKTKQKALIRLLDELEANNTKARQIAVCKNPAINKCSNFDFGHTSMLDISTGGKEGLVYVNLKTNTVYFADSIIDLS